MLRCLWLLLLSACSAGCQSEAERRLMATCEDLTEITDPPLRVYRGSRVDAERRILKGSEERCSDAAVARATLGIHAALRELLPELRPRSSVEVHVRPSWSGGLPARPIEVSGNPPVLLVDKVSLAKSVWLHELMHLRLRGARPGGLLERRVLMAFEEGVADFAAALLLGTPQIGEPELEERDLLAGRESGKHWEALAVSKDGRFDPHALGAPLARLLFATQREELLIAIAKALSLDEPYPDGQRGVRATLAELVRRCPASERELLASVIGDWLPEPLRATPLRTHETESLL